MLQMGLIKDMDDTLAFVPRRWDCIPSAEILSRDELFKNMWLGNNPMRRERSFFLDAKTLLKHKGR